MIPLFKVSMSESVIEPLKKVLLSGYIGQGKKVEEFEKALAPWVGNPNCLSLNSGTSALHLALWLAGVKPGTNVITTPMTCTATNAPILALGASIIWADIDPWTGNIDPLDVARKITPETRAILAVHWGGYPCELDELSRISQKYGIPIIEDAAHAFDTKYKGKSIGSISNYTCFSFQAIKHLTTVDGGLLVCSSHDDYRRGKLLRWYGIDRETPRRDLRCEEDIVECGLKFHMNDVNAIIGIEQLKHVNKVLEAHRANADHYNVELKKLKRISLLRYHQDCSSSYWLYTIRARDRDMLQQFLAKQGIMASQVHIRNDQHTAFKGFRRILPGVDEFAAEQISIPVG